jgi:ABC-type uncharacterized transport system permease subunit
MNQTHSKPGILRWILTLSALMAGAICGATLGAIVGVLTGLIPFSC